MVLVLITLSKLPTTTANMAQTHLDYSNQQLASVPSEIGSMTALQQLYLDNNQLTSLPPEIGNMTVLQQLDLTSNPISHLLVQLLDHPLIKSQFKPTYEPCHAKHIPSLQRLYPLHAIAGTYFAVIPKDICGMIADMMPLHVEVQHLR